MKKLVTPVLLVIALPAFAAILSWSPPNYYTSGQVIFPVDKDYIMYMPYTGNSASGPWIPLSLTPEGATSASVPEPDPGTTLWYTVDANLYGMTSVKAAAVSKTVDPLPPPILVPEAPGAVVVQ